MAVRSACGEVHRDGAQDAVGLEKNFYDFLIMLHRVEGERPPLAVLEPFLRGLIAADVEGPGGAAMRDGAGFRCGISEFPTKHNAFLLKCPSSNHLGDVIMRLKSLAIGALAVIAMPAWAERGFTVYIGVHPEVDYSAREAGETLSIWRRSMSAQCGAFEFFSPSLSTLDDDLPNEVDGGSQAVLQQFANSGTSIQVVPSIVACPEPPARGLILGCARPKGPILAVKRSNRRQDAQIWAHEVGHAQGLNRTFPGYNGGHNDKFGYLMYRSASKANWDMTDAECDQYFTSQNFPPAVTAVAEDIVIPDLPEEAPSPDEALPLQILEADWPHGFDFVWVERLGESLISASEMAIDEGNIRLWPNSVLVIGYANAEGALNRLITVLSLEEAEEIDRLSLNEAKANAMLALGYLAFHVNGDALPPLINGMSPNRVQSSIPILNDGRKTTEVARQIARSSTVGLAIAASQSDRAAELLEEQRMLQERGAYDIGVDDAYFNSLNELTNSIRENGLSSLNEHDPLQ